MKSELSYKGKWQEQTFENRKWRKLQKKMLSPHPLFLQLLLRTKESFQPAVPSCCSSWQPEILMRPEWLLHIPYPAKQTLAAHPISEATVIWHWHEFSLRVWPQPSMILTPFPVFTHEVLVQTTTRHWTHWFPMVTQVLTRQNLGQRGTVSNVWEPSFQQK